MIPLAPRLVAPVTTPGAFVSPAVAPSYEVRELRRVGGVVFYEVYTNGRRVHGGDLPETAFDPDELATAASVFFRRNPVTPPPRLRLEP